MRKQSYSLVVKDLTAAELWAVWTDVPNWVRWMDDIDGASLSGPFEVGQHIQFKPKGGPTLKLAIVDVVQGTSFTDVTRFPLARMYDQHDVVDSPEGVTIVSTIWLEGPLAGVWGRLVAQNIIDNFAAQTEALVTRARQLRHY